MYTVSTMMSTRVALSLMANFFMANFVMSDGNSYHPFVELNFDFVGNDVGSAPGSAVDKCMEPCMANPKCKAYSWSNYKLANSSVDGTCWLKSDRKEVVAKYGVISSYMWEQQVQTCQKLVDTDFVGNDIAQVPSPEVDKCCYICSKTYNCRSYSWTNFNSGTCFLKSGHGIAVTKKGVISADVYPNDEPLLMLKEGVDFVDHDIANKPSNTPEGCFDICKSVNGCRSFTHTSHNGGTCWLKSSSTATEVQKSGAFSAVVKPNSKCGFQADVDYSGNDIVNVPGIKNPEDCCNLCADTKDCKRFTHTFYMQGTCWLKNNQGTSLQAKGANSGTLSV